MTPEQTDRAPTKAARCACAACALVIQAADDLRVVEQDAGELAPGQVLVRVGYGGIRVRPALLPRRAASAPCASSGR